MKMSMPDGMPPRPNSDPPAAVACDVVQAHDPTRRGFASDNYSGVHPEMLAALAVVNGGHQPAYGNDVYTQGALQEVFRRHFGERAQAFPVFNGTGANIVALSLTVPRWGAVICTDTAHVHVDECGAGEKTAGLKFLVVETPDGKLTPELVERHLQRVGDEHFAQASTVTITQSSELGTVYTVEEVRALVEHAHRRGLRVHMDGARIANAAVALDVPLAAFTTDVGVDVLSFGGTKNGLMGGEVVVVLDPDAVTQPLFLRKLSMQLASKMRFVSAQFVALLSGDLWKRSAAHANAMASALSEAVAAVPGVTLLHPTQANEVFAVLPLPVVARLRERFDFYDWGPEGQVRWVTSFDTTADDVRALTQAVADEMAAATSGA